jgi:hypothetical protein
MKRSGFSLIEVNMAVFVLAIGVLSMAVLYPLGLRESIQSQADIKQSMFADFILNAAVSAASSTNVSWRDEWAPWATQNNTVGQDEDREFPLPGNNTPVFVKRAVDQAMIDYNGNQLSEFKHKENKTYAMYCFLVQGSSDRIMGIMVRSLDMDTSNMGEDEMVRRLESQPSYYAEARFMGFPDK